MAAFRLFLERGYGATSIDAIARAAGVSERTVYVAFKDKVSLMTAIADHFRYGGTEGGEDGARFVESLRAVPDPMERLRLVVHQGAMGKEQGLALIARMVRAEAPGEPRLRQFLERAIAYRHRYTRALVELVLGHGLADGGTTDLLIDEVEAINSEEVYLLLAVEREWSRDRYEAWVIDMCLDALRRHGVEPPGALDLKRSTERNEGPGASRA